MRFIHLSDTHVSPLEPEFNLRAHQAVREAIALEPAFAIVTGDLTQHGTREDFATLSELLDAFDVPVHVMPGNHDVGNKRSGYTDDHVTSERLALYEELAGPRYYSCEYDGLHFSCLDSNVLNSGLPTEREQMEWLAQDLAAAHDARYRIVITHYPLFWDSLEEELGENSGYYTVEDPARSELAALLADHDVSQYLAGHVHQLLEGVHRTTRFVTAPATSFSVTPDQSLIGYRLVEVDENGLHCQFRQLRLPADFRAEPPPYSPMD
ncbi:MAG: metallophosphoesterase family protein [Armatimonadota bacterium]